eukprot:3329044-Rhodomonas_salina.1
MRVNQRSPDLEVDADSRVGPETAGWKRTRRGRRVSDDNRGLPDDDVGEVGVDSDDDRRRQCAGWLVRCKHVVLPRALPHGPGKDASIQSVGRAMLVLFGMPMCCGLGLAHRCVAVGQEERRALTLIIDDPEGMAKVEPLDAEGEQTDPRLREEWYPLEEDSGADGSDAAGEAAR